jgi:hypothetical protein
MYGISDDTPQMRQNFERNLHTIQASASTSRPGRNTQTASRLSYTIFFALDQKQFRESVPYHGRRLSSMFLIPKETQTEIPVQQDFSTKFGRVHNQFVRSCNASWYFVAADIASYLNVSAEYLTSCVNMLDCKQSSVDNALKVMRKQSCTVEEYQQYGCSQSQYK